MRGIFPSENDGLGLERPEGAESFRSFPLMLKIGFWACLVIAVAVVLRRGIALLAGPSAGAPPQPAQLDATFASHATITWLHIGCALAVVGVLPFVFWRPHSQLFEHVFFPLGFLVAATAYGMTRSVVGGWLERSAVLVFNTWFVVALARALWFARHDYVTRKQTWIVRAVAVLLGIATTRPVMGVFFATSRFTHLTPHQFFGVAFWIGFSINLLVVELWLQAERTSP